MTTIVLLFYGFLIGSALCLVPEVSQEGLLQPFATYSDVSLFHYHVPPEVERVTWEFAAFMDDPNCPKRDVHILVQHGSYPVFGTFNGTFPSYIYNRRSSLHEVVTRTAFQPHDPTVLPVYNPLPGSWFAAAYIPDWNEQMQQEGIVHKCRYSLGSIAMWSQKEHIKTLHIGSSQVVYTHKNLSYFRFYVSSHTWLLKVNISNCVILEQNDTKSEELRWCIQIASLKARALPTYEPNVGVVNISHGSGHVFHEKHPFSDSYYYLLLYTEGETEVTIIITAEECGGLMMKPLTPVFREIRSLTGAKEAVHNFLPGNATELLSISNHSLFWGNFVHNSSNSFEDIWSDVSSGLQVESGTPDLFEENRSDHRCFPVLPLARIKHSRDFTDTFLVQGPEWYSTWVSVHSETPVFTHMTLLPFTDIGGTLSITLHMDELLMNATSQLITVVGCVRKGRPPLLSDVGLECERELTLNASSASTEAVEDFLLIPFPEPDTWYLALHVTCYYKGAPSPCIISQVMVSIDVRTQPCVYAGPQPCGDHGVCQETHRGMFFFSSCVCEEGWRGWGCHDGQLAPMWGPLVSRGVLLTISNIFFLPPIIMATKRSLYTQAILFTATMVASVLYHACDSEVFSLCVTRFEVLQFTDFFFSLLCFWVTVVSLGNTGNDQVNSVLNFVGVVIIAPAVQHSRTGLLSFVVPMVIAVLIAVCRVLLVKYQFGTWPKISKRQGICRICGLTLASSGLVLFAFIQTKDNYKYVHSAWHVVIAVSLLFLLPSGDVTNIKKFSSRPSSTETLPYVDDDSELLDVGRHSIAFPDLSSNIRTADVDLIQLE